jgi:tetratricopeptide (TPR) repeat protein
MAVSSPTGRQSRTASSGKKPPPGRTFWRLVWRVAATAILGAIGAAAGFYTESLLKDLPKLPEQIRDAPGVVRIVVIVVIAILIALVIASYFWGKTPDEDAGGALGPQLDDIAQTGQDIRDDTTAIKQQVTDIAALLTAEAPAIPATVRASSLPRPATLIGRDKALADLMASLRAGKSVSVVVAVEGMGGVGKTALAAEAVARLANSGAFPGGAVWVSVAGLTGANGLAEVWTRVGSELGLSQLAALTDPEARRSVLRGALAERAPTLLALDNVERDLNANALLDTLAIEGHTTLLLTSRYPLAPQRLVTVSLRPLPAPDAESLFRDQMRRRNARRPNATDEQFIGTLAEMVGGLPLAVELVAAYASGQELSLATVLKELRNKGLNAAAYDDPLYPQRALVATFEQSWAILTEPQRQLFAGLGLLPESSFPRVVALALATATEPPASESDLAALVSYALVEPLAEERQRLHPLLHEYAAQKLRALPEAGQTALGQAMAAYWITFAREHPGYEGMDALAEENDGLMAALTWAHDHQQHESLLALANALSHYWFVRGRIDDALLARPWALEAAQATQNQPDTRWALHELAVLKAQTGDVVGAQAGYEQALALARQLHDPAAERVELHGLAVLKSKTGDVVGAQAGFEQALALARQLHDPAAEQRELHELAVLKAQTGDVVGAQSGFEAALSLARQLRDPAAIAMELRCLGVMLGQNGEPERGRPMIEESLALSEQLRDPQAIGDCHQFLAWLDERAGNRAGAVMHYREALRHFAQVRSPDAEDVRRDLRALGEDA